MIKALSEQRSSHLINFILPQSTRRFPEMDDAIVMQGGYQDIPQHSLVGEKGHLGSSARLQVLLMFNFTGLLVTPVKNTTATTSTPAAATLE